MYMLYLERRPNVEITRLANSKKFDYLVIESSGISEPLPVAETFTFTKQW